MAGPKVFVSHSHQDNAYCREFVAAVRKGLGSDEAVWYDEHNLGWGALRQVIETELAQRQHFIAILSPVAVTSTWVNAEIDAALGLATDGSMQTVQFVVAEACTVPLLLRRYKRIEQPGGTGYSPAEAAAKVLLVIAPTATQPAPPQPQGPVIPSDRFPQRLADLGFTAHSDNGIEYILPPMCAVPAGSFLMGSDPKRDKRLYVDEKPQQSVRLPAYDIARFPVTVAEYARFVRAGHAAPKDWQTQLSKLDHPVVRVSWHDAVAYAAWLSERTGERWWLPTEAEWEKAARGTDGRIYPWGDAFDQARCNTEEGGKNATTPIGTYPTGASLYGAHDMAGNVWEWTGSLKVPYPYTISGEREDPKFTGSRVLRGGSWGYGARRARAACRINFPPVFVVGYGFRLVRASPNS